MSSDFLQVIEQAIAMMQQESQRGMITGGTVTGGLVILEDVDKLAIVGDLHGDTRSLFRILDEIGYEGFLSNPNNKIIFLGDYVDRGHDSVGILYSICYLKWRYRDSVILMRGNHEAPAEFPFSSHDLPYELQDRFGYDARAIYNKTLLFFKLLTLATVVRDRLLLVHGGLPTDQIDLESMATAQENHIKDMVMAELLWNDPRPLGGRGWEPSPRGIGRYFGPVITKKWLDATGARVVIRGHEPCKGFKLDHNNTILTLFSSKEPYPGCEAAYLLTSKDQLAAVKNACDLAIYVKILSL